MKAKKFFCLSLITVIAISGISFVFAEENIHDTNSITEDADILEQLNENSTNNKDEQSKTIQAQTILENTAIIAYQDENVVGGYFYFDETTGTITDADTSLTSVVIPDKINGVNVTSIGKSAFEDCNLLESVVIPDSITTINMYAFYRCKSLASVNIPNAVTSIEDFVFSDCKSLKSMVIPKSVTSIKTRAFEGCSSLKSIDLPESITYIGYGAFNCCGLTSIDLPSNITAIQGNTFGDCSALKSITIPSNVVSIGDYAFRSCTGLVSMEIPDKVTSIGNFAFSGCYGLENIDLNNVYSIGENAFEHCNSLENVTIPNSVRTIMRRAFYYCLSLTTVTIPKSVTSIDVWAFGLCQNLSDIYYEGSEEQWLKIKHINYIGISDSTIIHYNDVSQNPESSTEMTTDIVTNTTAEESTEINTEQSTDIITEATTISYNAGDGTLYFNNSSGTIVGADKDLTTLKIPSSIENVEVKAIGDNAFSTCSNLTDITIPQSVTSISKNAFEGCPALTVHCYKGSCADDATLYPEGSTLLYMDETSEKGDINGDGQIDSHDSLILFKHIAGDAIDIDESLVDFNKDNIVDSRDSLILFKFVAGDNVTLE